MEGAPTETPIEHVSQRLHKLVSFYKLILKTRILVLDKGTPAHSTMNRLVNVLRDCQHLFFFQSSTHDL